MEYAEFSGEKATRLVFFFFSSRRRHTRLQGDWSSDVCSSDLLVHGRGLAGRCRWAQHPGRRDYTDRKSTRLNSSHLVISYAVFCLKKKKKKKTTIITRSYSS